jgi:hypothetical protein
VSRTVLILVIAVSIVAAHASAASATPTRTYAGDASYVVARQPNPDVKIRIVASLHDLDPGHDYVLVGSSHRCANADEPGGRVFRAPIRAATRADDVFTKGRVAARMPLRTMRSVLYYDENDVSPGQEVGCAARVKPPANSTTGRTCGRLGGLLGCVAATQEEGSNRIRLLASIHGLLKRERYVLVASTQPCGKPHTDQDQVFGLVFNTQDGSDDVFSSRFVNAAAPLAKTRSVRLLLRPDDQRFCDDMTIAE